MTGGVKINIAFPFQYYNRIAAKKKNQQEVQKVTIFLLLFLPLYVIHILTFSAR
jgi:hypothetical protein